MWPWFPATHNFVTWGSYFTSPWKSELTILGCYSEHSGTFPRSLFRTEEFLFPAPGMGGGHSGGADSQLMTLSSQSCPGIAVG